MLVTAGKYWEVKHISDGEVSLTLESTSEVSLANRKILSDRSSPDFRYLPARHEGDRTMKHSSSELVVRGVLIAPLVLCARLVEVSGRSLHVICLRFGCSGRWFDEEKLESTDFRPT